MLRFIFSAVTGAVLLVSVQAAESVVWNFDNLTAIGGNATTKAGSPTVIESTIGKAVEFAGEPDQLLVTGYPLDTATSITIELILNPYDIASSSDLNQPRVIHIEDANDDTKRITMELRISGTNWGTDAYILNGSSKCTLAGDKTHPVDTWYNFTMTYSNNSFNTYVNGVADESGTVTYGGIPKTAIVSIGCRQNNVNYFKGAVRKIIFTPSVLTPDQFDKSYAGTPIMKKGQFSLLRNAAQKKSFVSVTNSNAVNFTGQTLINLAGQYTSPASGSQTLTPGVYIRKSVTTK